MVLLQAFTDDSATDVGDRRLFLAGYLHSAAVWARFSDAWSDALRASPSIKYLKMVEANGLRGQFAGWTRPERDKKLECLANIIDRFGFFSFESSVSRRDYDNILKPVSPRGLGNAHFTCNFCIVSGVSRYASSIDKKLLIEFNFDEQRGVDADMAIFFDMMKENLPRPARDVINGTPIFKDDKQVLPLQAADMLAWHIRKEHEVGRSIDNPLTTTDRLLGSAGHLVMNIDNSYIESWAKQFKQFLGVSFTQTKSQWQNIRREFSELQRSGFLSPSKDPEKFAALRTRMDVLARYMDELKTKLNS